MSLTLVIGNKNYSSWSFRPWIAMKVADIPFEERVIPLNEPGSREEILRAADIFLENGVYIETGPHKHAIQQTFFLYVYEPGGNRVEVANAGARLILAPDWKPIVWTEEERKKGQAWGLKTIESFHTHGTPPVED